MDLNKYSKTITQDETQPAAQAMLYGIGLTEEDLGKPQIGIASTGYEGNTCNMHLNDMAVTIKESVINSNLVGLIFNTIGVSDGISNGTAGMRYSLVSRDVIADSMETVMGAQWYDGMVAVVGCDKNMPGSIIAMGRLNRPAIMVFGGTIHSGSWNGEKLNIVSAFEALGQKLNNSISNEDFKGVIKNSCPGAGACGGMYTANTMAAAIEALGMSLPYSSSNPALSESKNNECQAVGVAMMNLLRLDIKPRDIMTMKAFENAITLITVLGGSTNAVLHLIAMADSVGLELTLDDFNRIDYENVKLIINPNVYFSDINYNNQSVKVLGGSNFVILRKSFTQLSHYNTKTSEKLKILFGLSSLEEETKLYEKSTETTGTTNNAKKAQTARFKILKEILQNISDDLFIFIINHLVLKTDKIYKKLKIKLIYSKGISKLNRNKKAAYQAITTATKS